MRRILITCAGAVIAAAALSTVWADQSAQKGKNAKAVKQAAEPGYGNSDAISEAEMQIYLYFLASDQLEGRNFPSRGYDTAALYVASHLAEWGLKPGGSQAGTTGPLQPYLMPIELAARSLDTAAAKLELTAPAQGGRGRGGQGGGAGANAGAGAGANGANGGRAGRNGGRGRGNGGGAGADGAPAPVTTTFEYAKEWSVAGGGGGRGAAVEPIDMSGELVFAGNGYLVEKTKTNPYEGLDVKGKIIVVSGVPQEIAAQQEAAAARGGRGGGGGRGAAENPLGEACKDYWTPEQYAAKNGALGVITVANFQQATAMANPNGAAGRGFGGGGGGRAGLNGPNFQVVKFRTASACPAAPAITAGMELTNALFQGEKLNGSQVFYNTGANAKQESFALNAAKKISLKVGVNSTAGHGENVVGIIEGGDPVLKNEYVIMSAHLDHIGLSNPLPDGHNVNNGADDDGSGSAGLLAVAHSYAEGVKKGIRPKRTVVFLWNGGEEKGLLGSQYFAEFPPIDLTKVVADLNMDMIGRSKNANSVDNNPQHVLVDPGKILLIGPNISSDDLGNVIDKVNGGYQKLGVDHFYDTTAPDATHDNLGPQPNGQRIFYRSDHYNFAKMGIPIAFFTTGLHVDYHAPTDTPDKIDYHQMQIVAKTVSAVGWQLATQDQRPEIKAHLPEQLVKDMKAAKDAGWGKVTPVLSPLPGEPY